MNTAAVPRLPAWLGYAGLLPFVTLASLLWLLPAPWQRDIAFALVAYAAVILAFMGAAHWGLGMAANDGERAWQLGLSVVPPLLAWVALLLPPLLAYALLTVSFGVLLLADTAAAQRALTPDWYPGLRIPLTLVVMLSLICASLALV